MPESQKPTVRHRRLYRLAILADARFRSELERVYGQRNTGDRRYQVGRYQDQELQQARVDFVAASEALHKANMRALARQLSRLRKGLKAA